MLLWKLFQLRERAAANAIMGIEDASTVERVTPDFAAEYGRLAPLVSEAFVYLEVGRREEALKALRAAQEIIQTVSSPFFSSVLIKSKAKPNQCADLHCRCSEGN